MEYQLIRSARKTIAIEITAENKIIVRAPKRCSKALAEAFLQEKSNWILRKQQEMEKRREERKHQRAELAPWSDSDYEKARNLARFVLNQKVVYYAKMMNVTYGRITIRDQKTRWGSCSSCGNLNFNWRLILAPEGVQDYVVVHELAHRKQMNHSPDFWAVVEGVLPDYAVRRQWLKQHGSELMMR